MTFLPHVSADRSAEPAPTPAPAPFQIRGRFFTAIVLQLTGPIDAAFYAALDLKLAQAAQFFAYVPLVLDLDAAADFAIDFPALLDALRARKLTLVGIQNGTDAQKRAARAAGLVTLQGGRDMPLQEENRPGLQPGRIEPPTGNALIVTQPVRSGQRVFADAGDLIVTAAVSSGAELMARGNIHVYGRMRGRALAGANGNTKARIFCHSLEAELIAIAGVYRTCEDISPLIRRERAQVFLDGDALCIELLR